MHSDPKLSQVDNAETVQRVDEHKDIALIGLIIFTPLRSSPLLLKVSGASGMQAMSCLMGLFVMAIGVQLIRNGLADWFQSLGLVLN